MKMLHQVLQGEIVGGPLQLRVRRRGEGLGEEGEGKGGYVVWAERVYLRGSW